MVDDELAEWLRQDYERSFRTACLIVGNRADAEEAVQEAFLRAWRFRGAIGAASARRPWLYRIVVNTCNSKLREEVPHRDQRAGDAPLDEVPDGSVSPADAAGQAWEGREIAAALAALPPHLREVVVLRYYADLAEREIATAIGRRPGTVKSRLHEARQRLAADPTLRRLAGDTHPEPEEARGSDREAAR
jgi:RNA polymerase sigma-70 factor (ECF subfamily)